ncbi:MAG: cytochrome c [Candidatus Lambdaproteobacteria bacterium]|nr:cytochrome c [Candidatus Lambdaproteobacteria bacterium]
MNFKRKPSKAILLGGVVALVLMGAAAAIAWAAGAMRPDYQGYDLARPWFDGRSYPFYLDMFNQPSLKPQEEGTLQEFPQDSVPRTGSEAFIEATALVGGQLQRDLEPLNPTKATPASIRRGRFIYETYCSVCHGLAGEANTPVAQRGMPAPPITGLIPLLSEPHLYNKALYGGPLMPPYGFQTTQQDRWDMVNYMKSPQFGQGGSQ